VKGRILTIALALAISAGPARGQEPRVWLEARKGKIGIGDTLEVDVVVETSGRLLTSASVYVSFDDGALALVPEQVLEDGTVLPFRNGPFLPVQVYENSTAGDTVGAVRGNDLGGFQLNYVSVSGTGSRGGRPVGRGRGELASFRLRVTGYPEDGKSAIRLDAAGQRWPVYTELDEPGVERRFQVPREPLQLSIEGEGLLPVEDVALEAGGAAAVQLGPHYFSLKWGREEIAWEAWSGDPEQVEVRVEGQILFLRAAPQVAGRVRVEYRAAPPDGRVREGGFEVVVADRPPLLVRRELVLQEDAGPVRFGLDEFLVDGAAAADLRWEVETGGRLEVRIEGEELVVVAPRDWHGRERALLRLLDSAGLRDTATVVLAVAPVNDAPEIGPLSPVAVAVGGWRQGPELGAVIRDVDHDLDDLGVRAIGDAFARGEVADGFILIQGVQAGEGQIRIEVEDPAGAKSAAVLPVVVRSGAGGPAIGELPVLQVPVGETRALSLGEYVSAGSASLETLEWEVRVQGGIVADLEEGAEPVLRVRGMVAGPGRVELQAADARGSAAAALAVEVLPASASLPPELRLPGIVELVSGQRAVWSLGELGSDPDTAPGGLSWTVEGGTALGVVLEAGQLAVQAPEVEREFREEFEVQVRDPEGNAARGVLQVVVVPGRKAPDAVESSSEEEGPVPEAGETAEEEAGEEGIDPVRQESESAAIEAGTGSEAPGPAAEEQSGDTGGAAEEQSGDTGGAAEEQSGDTGGAAEEQSGDTGGAAEEQPGDTGGAAEEQPGDTGGAAENPDSGVLRLRDFADVELPAGGTRVFALDEYVAAGVAEQLAWSVAAGGGLEVEIDAERRLRVTAPADFAGREVLLLTARDRAGGTATGVVRIAVQAPADVRPGEGGEEASIQTAGESGRQLELALPPEYRVVAGTLDTALVLDALVTLGEPGAVVWSVRGGVRVRARIDAERRLILDARQALPGREVFFLEASLENERLSVPLGVSVRASRFAVRPLPPLEIEAGAVDSSLSLDAYVEGDFAPAQIEWGVLGPEDIRVEIDAERRLRVAGTGEFEVFLEARAPTGAAEVVALRVTATEAPAVQVEAALPDPGEAPVLRLPEVVIMAPAEVRELEDLVADGDTDPERLAWEVRTEGTGEATGRGGGLRLVAGDGNFRVHLAVTDPQGNRSDGVLEVSVRSVDRRPPRLTLEGRPLPGGVVEFRVRADEELAGPPSLAVDGRELAVMRGEGHYASRYVPPRDGVIQVHAEGLDAAGNAGSARLTAAVGRMGSSSRSLVSADGRVRVQVPRAAGSLLVLVHPERGGYRVDFPAGQVPQVEVVFAHDFFGRSPTAGILRWNASTAEWEEIPAWANPETERVFASISSPGVFKVGETEAPVRVWTGPVAYPNPFNAAVWIRYLAPQAGLVRLRIYDVRGGLVRQWVEQVQTAGPWTAVWNGRQADGQAAASGTYFFLVETREGKRAGKMTLVR